MTDLPHLPSIDDPNIYLDVLTHSSLVHGGTIPNEDYGDNTRLQQLGESALTLAVTDRLFSLRPMLPSQDILAKKQEYLSDENIDNWVEAYGLKSRLVCHPDVRNEINTPYESKVLLHTYIGAVYYKKGLGPIAEWVKRIVESSADSASPPRPAYPIPPSSSPPAFPPSSPGTSQTVLARFNETANKARRQIDWECKSEGASHTLLWTVSCLINHPAEGQNEKVLVGTGQGSSKNAAKENAARVASGTLGWGLI